MTGGLKGHSVTDLTHALKGISLPASKQDVVQHAKSNGTDAEIMKILEGMPDGEYATVAEVTKGAGNTGSKG